MEEVLIGDFPAAQLGRVILASRINILFALDFDWTREKVLPLLDWSLDEERAKQAWDGYLFRGRFSDNSLPHLLPLYEACFSRLSLKLSDMRDSFCRHLASIAIHSSRDPLEDGWLNKFIAIADIEDRVSWASTVDTMLHPLDDDKKIDLWQRWLDKYWSRRLDAIPRKLDPKEIEEMVAWIANLEPIFPEVAKKICATPQPQSRDSFLYAKLSEKRFALNHPKWLARLLGCLLTNTTEPIYHFQEIHEMVEVLANSDVPKEDLLAVCNELARLGYRKASDLRDLVETDRGTQQTD